jgi:hypothetical protein
LLAFDELLDFEELLVFEELLGFSELFPIPLLVVVGDGVVGDVVTLRLALVGEGVDGTRVLFSIPVLGGDGTDVLAAFGFINLAGRSLSSTSFFSSDFDLAFPAPFELATRFLGILDFLDFALFIPFLLGHRESNPPFLLPLLLWTFFLLRLELPLPLPLPLPFPSFSIWE